MDDDMKLTELAERSGVPPRTIRHYIAQGLLPGPRRAGPRSAYGPEHLDRLERIRALQSEGLTLSDIRRRLDGAAVRSSSLPDPETVRRFQLAPDVVVEVRGDPPPWRVRAITKALNQFAEAVRPDDQGERL